VAEEPFVPDPSSFGERLIHWNGLAATGFAAWEFLPGMKFAERGTWWRNGADRTSAHEGLDIFCCRTRDGRRLSLGAGARVPAIYPGVVVTVVDDFLGSSVFVAHERRDRQGRRLHTVYGHVDPCPGLVPGSLLGDEDLVGVIADPATGKGSVPPHLHITLALIAGPGPLDWPALRDPAWALLLDPLPVIYGQHESFQASSPRPGPGQGTADR
jgi:hypothetical protein